MSEVLLLTDSVVFGTVGNGRYMGAYAIASAARRAGFDVTVIDYFTRHPDFFSYVSHFLNEETLCVGISSTFLAPAVSFNPEKQRSQRLKDFYSGELWKSTGEELVSWLESFKELMKRKSPRAQLVLGGVKSQYAIWRPQYYRSFDQVFVGASDFAFVDYLRSIKENCTPKATYKNDISFVDNSFDIENKFCPETIWTAQDAVQNGEALPLEVSRGCSFNCKFCHYSKSASFRKDPDTLRAELIRNYENFQTTTYSFCDDCFNDHPSKVETYCKMFKSLPFKIEWTAYARVDVPVKFPWTLDLMIEAGARGLYWGIESFDHEVARRAGKGTPTEKVQELIQRFGREYSSDCLSELSFITGLPGENSASLEQTERWLLANPVYDFLSVGSLGLTPYIESLDKKLFDYADYSRNPEKYGFRKVSFKPDYWEHDTMNLPQAQEWASRIRQSFLRARPGMAIGTIWLYPHLRSLGYNQTEIFALARNSRNIVSDTNEIKSRFASFMKNYWSDLLQFRTHKGSSQCFTREFA